MPIGYIVEAQGRTGAALRVARGTHEVVATGKAARLGTLVPHIATTTTKHADGRPLEVRVPFAFVAWLVMGSLVASDEVAALFIFEYVVGAERMGLALDTLRTRLRRRAPRFPVLVVLAAGGRGASTVVPLAGARVRPPALRCPSLARGLAPPRT